MDTGALAPAPVTAAAAVAARGETLVTVAPSRGLGRLVVGRTSVGPGFGPWAWAGSSASGPSLSCRPGGPACPAIRPIWLPSGFPRPPSHSSSRALTLALPTPAANPSLPPPSPPAPMTREWHDAGTRPKRRADDRRPESSRAEERRDSFRPSPDAMRHESELRRQLSSRGDRRSPAYDDHRSPSRRSPPRADRRGRSRSPPPAAD
nr:translation initiation factor IF-2-like [Aegilops tauschii subsp. strangulata]